MFPQQTKDRKNPDAIRKSALIYNSYTSTTIYPNHCSLIPTTCTRCANPNKPTSLSTSRRPVAPRAREIGLLSFSLPSGARKSGALGHTHSRAVTLYAARSIYIELHHRYSLTSHTGMQLWVFRISATWRPSKIHLISQAPLSLSTLNRGPATTCFSLPVLYVHYSRGTVNLHARAGRRKSSLHERGAL